MITRANIRFSACLISSLLIILSVGIGFADAEKPAQNDEIRVGLVSSEGGFVYGGFNHLAFTGFEQAAATLGVHTKSLESFDPDDIEENINWFVENGYNLIITLGYQSKPHVAEAARQNPDVHFALIDGKYENDLPNLTSFVYRVDQAAFLCGYLAAWWALEQNSDSPMVGWIGGPQIPEIDRFRKGFESGVEFFNNEQSTSVSVSGSYTTGFMNPEEGTTAAEKLIQKGASVIFPFAGITGYGALNSIKEHGKWAIGVDSDQFFTFNEVADILLTSCVKQLDVTVFDIVHSFTRNGNLGENSIRYGTLADGSVDIAPFHTFDDQIPDEVKDKLSQLRAEIMNGGIATGWD
jgi:basic membrane protein A